MKEKVFLKRKIIGTKGACSTARANFGICVHYFKKNGLNNDNS